MSDAFSQEDLDRENELDEHERRANGSDDDPSTEEEKAEARRQGWRPEEEWDDVPEGDPRRPKKFVTAHQFLARGEDPKILHERVRTLGKQNDGIKQQLSSAQENIASLERMLAHLTRANKATAMREYERGKAEATSARRAAIESADPDAVEMAEDDLRQLEGLRQAIEEEPEPKPEPAENKGGTEGIDPNVDAWVKASAWFSKPGFRVPSAYMIDELDRLKVANPSTPEGNLLDEAEAATKRAYPKYFGGKENEARRAPPAVNEPTPPRPGPKKRTMKDIPQRDRQDFKKHKEMMAAQGVEYTEEEFLAGYPD